MTDFNKRYTISDLNELLQSNNDYVEEAILILYHFQTPEELDSMRGCEINYLGYSAPDAIIMVGYAEKLLTLKFLKDTEFEDARQRLYKYKRQLLAVLNNDIPNPLKKDIVVREGKIKKRNHLTYMMDVVRKFIVKMYTYDFGNSISGEAGTTGYCKKGPNSRLFVRLSKVSNNDKISFKSTRNGIEIRARGDDQISDIVEGLEFILYTLKGQIKDKMELDSKKK